MSLIFIVLGANNINSLCNRSVKPENIVVPPDMIMLPYKSLRTSTSHFIIELYVPSWIPAWSRPSIEGRNKTSGQRNRSLPIVMT